jgi:hypothetical protein
VTDVLKVVPTLRAMAAAGMLLLVHGEVTDSEVDMFDREAVFIREKLVGSWAGGGRGGGDGALEALGRALRRLQHGAVMPRAAGRRGATTGAAAGRQRILC